MKPNCLGSACLAEMIGTFLLVFFGCGSVHVAVLTGELVGLWQVAIVWGLVITMAIYLFGGISGAHLNPAVTVGMATWGKLPKAHAVPYIASQVAGAFMAAAMLFVLFGGLLSLKEKELGIERGKPGSELTAMCYNEYFPNPGPFPKAYHANEETIASTRALVPELSACIAEAFGAMILLLVIMAVTNPHNPLAPGPLAAPMIGLTVTMLICVIAPLTQACFNPARDFGPRVFAYLAGWGEVALPGQTPTGFFTVYILSPIVGGILGVGIYQHIIGPAFLKREATT